MTQLGKETFFSEQELAVLGGQLMRGTQIIAGLRARVESMPIHLKDSAVVAAARSRSRMRRAPSATAIGNYREYAESLKREKELCATTVDELEKLFQNQGPKPIHTNPLAWIRNRGEYLGPYIPEYFKAILFKDIIDFMLKPEWLYAGSNPHARWVHVQNVGDLEYLALRQTQHTNPWKIYGKDEAEAIREYLKIS